MATATARYDAMEVREQLALELAAWKAAQFISSYAARIFERRLRTLAQQTGLTRQELLDDLEADVDQMDEVMGLGCPCDRCEQERSR